MINSNTDTDIDHCSTRDNSIDTNEMIIKLKDKIIELEKSVEKYKKESEANFRKYKKVTRENYYIKFSKRN
jgi:hypothetical protein